MTEKAKAKRTTKETAAKTSARKTKAPARKPAAPTRSRRAKRPDVTHDQIAKRAYELHLEGHGDAFANWLRAEHELTPGLTREKARA